MPKACLCLFVLVLSLVPGQTASSTTAELPAVERQPAPSRSLTLPSVEAWARSSVPLQLRVSSRKAHPEESEAASYLQTGTRSGSEVRVHFFLPKQIVPVSPPPRL